MKTLLLFVAGAMTFLVTSAEVSSTTEPGPRQVVGGSRRTLRPPQPEAAPFTTPEAMQAEFLRRFEESPGFGLSRVIRPRFLAPVPSLTWNGTAYRVVPPELVGLEDDPVVYAPREHGIYEAGAARLGDSTNVTRREVRKLFKNRLLTTLETNAIIALREGRDLIVLTNRVSIPNVSSPIDSLPGLLIYGALRAGKSCAACHQCDPGTLLGAFAYALTPLPAPAGGTNSPAGSLNLVASPP